MGWKEAPGMFIDTPSPAITQAILISILVLFLLRKLAFGARAKKLPPGPPGLPIVGNWLQFRDGINPRNLAAVSKKYGDVCLLRMGQRKVVVISSPEIAKEVLQTQGVEFGSRTRNIVFEITTGKGSDMVFADYGEHWRKMRRIATLPFFTSKIVQGFRCAWEEEINLAIKDIASSDGAATAGIIIRDRLQLMFYNMVYLMMFGARFNGENDPLYVKLMLLNHENNRLAQSFKYNYGDFFPPLKPFLHGYLHDVWDANQRRLNFLRDAFLQTRRTDTGKDRKIGVDYFLDAEKRGEVNESNVLYLIQNMNVAAIETTLWSSEWAVAELVNNPSIQSNLRDEMKRVVGEGVEITAPDIVKLPYLQAFVKEILRKHMVIPMLLPHSNLKDAKLGGYDIPLGSRVLVNAWGIGNDPRYWVRPEEFRPERFLEEEAGMEPNGSDLRFIPFGSGRRSCPGSVIALPLLALVVGRFIQAFQLEAPAGIQKVDMSESGGQLALTMGKWSRVVVKSIK